MSPTFSALLPWLAFAVIFLTMMALDLGVFHRQAHVVRRKEAALWSVAWIAVSLSFNLGILLFTRNPDRALEFLTGYVIEYSLSVDNLFVFLVVFRYFNVPATSQHRALFWGILGAILMRGTLIGVGVALIARFHWILYVFGGLLIITGIKLATQREDFSPSPDRNPVVRLFRRWMPVATAYAGDRFFVVKEGRRFATPLFVVLLIIETTDLVFALDSIPAVFGITRDPFIAFTSNIFAVLGLRALYFLLAGMMDSFHYLKYGLAFILTFIGLKMTLEPFLHVPITASLMVIFGTLALSIVASLLKRPPAPRG